MGNEAHRLGGALARQDSYASRLDGWIVPPDTAGRRKRGRGSGPRRTETMIQQQLLIDLVEQFCTYQHKQRGKTEGGARTYQWNLERFLMFFRKHEGRPARVTDLTQETVQAWMDQMADADLALSTMRSRQSTLSSFCSWLAKPVSPAKKPRAKPQRPPYERLPPQQEARAAVMIA